MSKQFVVTLNEDGTVYEVEEIIGIVRQPLPEHGYIGNNERAWMLREDDAENDNVEYHSVRLVEFWD